MKAKKLLFLSINVLATFTGVAQGFFQNLNFESATLVAIPGDSRSVQFGPAFPGWTGYIGGVQESSALYNSFFLDSSGIGILDQRSSVGAVIEGQFTALLEAGLGLGSGQPADTTLSQTGFVPSGTQSLLFQARQNVSAPSLVVTLGGQTLSLVPLAVTSGSTLYGADIHTFARQFAELSFTVVAERPYVGPNILYLDGIQFSPQAIPEPSTAWFFALGLGGLFFRLRWFGRKEWNLVRRYGRLENLRHAKRIRLSRAFLGRLHSP